MKLTVALLFGSGVHTVSGVQELTKILEKRESFLSKMNRPKCRKWSADAHKHQDKRPSGPNTCQDACVMTKFDDRTNSYCRCWGDVEGIKCEGQALVKCSMDPILHEGKMLPANTAGCGLDEKVHVIHATP